MLGKYERIIGSFLRKAEKLEKLAEKDGMKVIKLIDKAIRVKARIDAKIAKLEGKRNAYQDEATKAKGTADKLKEFFV